MYHAEQYLLQHHISLISNISSHACKDQLIVKETPLAAKQIQVKHMESQKQLEKAMMSIAFIIVSYPILEVLSDLVSVGQLFLFGANWCLKHYQLDIDLYKRCIATASNTECCLYLRPRPQFQLKGQFKTQRNESYLDCKILALQWWQSCLYGRKHKRAYYINTSKTSEKS